MNFKLFVSPIGSLITSINDTISFYIDNENQLKLFCLQKIKWEKKAITYEDLMRLNIKFISSIHKFSKLLNCNSFTNAIHCSFEMFNLIKSS